MKRHLEDTIKDAYYHIDNEVVQMKSALINLCAEIDRYFRVAFGIDVRKEADDETLNKFILAYPRFYKITKEQLNRLFTVFISIRNTNAHLFLNRPIFLDQDLADLMVSICEPKWKISKNNELTMYGSFYILMLLSQKYMIWPATTNFLKKQHFEEIPKAGDEMALFQADSQKYFQKCCGRGKPILYMMPDEDKLTIQFLSTAIQTNLTKIFFDLERTLVHRKTAYLDKSPAFSKLLKNNAYLDNDLIVNQITQLRNVWLHGYLLNDDYDDEENHFKVTFDFILELLISFKEALPNDASYRMILSDLNDFASAFFDHYALRVIELGYKLLDSRLFVEEKTNERIANAIRAAQRIKEKSPEFYEKLGRLLGNSGKTWYVGASKFLDKKPREMTCKTVDLCIIRSENGFFINDYHIDTQAIILPKLDGILGDENRINYKKLEDYHVKQTESYSSYFRFVTLE